MTSIELWIKVKLEFFEFLTDKRWSFIWLAIIELAARNVLVQCLVQCIVQ